MTNKEFNLSEKIEFNYEEIEYEDGCHTHEDIIEIGEIRFEDVAEFIREIDTLCSLLIDGQISMAEFQDRRKKLAGEKFK